MKKNSLLAFVAIGLVSFSALAQPKTQNENGNRFEQRASNQEQRIERGMANGNINPDEAKKLQQGQAQVKEMRSQAMTGGKVSPKERNDLRHAQNQQSKRIAHDAHNGKGGPGGGQPKLKHDRGDQQ
jgi:hypothetical protein